MEMHPGFLAFSFCVIVLTVALAEPSPTSEAVGTKRYHTISCPNDYGDYFRRYDSYVCQDTKVFDGLVAQTGYISLTGVNNDKDEVNDVN